MGVLPEQRSPPIELREPGISEGHPTVLSEGGARPLDDHSMEQVVVGRRIDLPGRQSRPPCAADLSLQNLGPTADSPQILKWISKSGPQLVAHRGGSLLSRIWCQENFSDNKVDNNSLIINDSSNTIQNTTSIKNLQQRSLSFRFHIDKKDDPLFPKKGYLFDIYFKSTGYFLGGERDYHKLDLSLNTYFSIIKKSVVATRLKLGKLWSWEDSYIDYSY